MSKSTVAADILADPFQETSACAEPRRLQLLGARFRFESDSRALLRLVDVAYAGLPSHRMGPASPELRIKLLLTSAGKSHRRAEPPEVAMLSARSFLGGTTAASNWVVLSPRERTALVVISPGMIRFPYHARYEFIEFAVYTLAARVQKLVPLHAACVGRAGLGILLMGPSGSGKSTVALHCLLEGLEFIAEDAVFVAADTLRATGIANYLHVCFDSLSWLDRSQDRVTIVDSPIIRRRSGVEKYEVDLRRLPWRLAASPLKIAAVVFLSSEPAGDRPLLRPLSKAELRAKLAAHQAYAANQPRWRTFTRNLTQVETFELRRGSHPRDAVGALQRLLGAPGDVDTARRAVKCELL